MGNIEKINSNNDLNFDQILKINDTDRQKEIINNNHELKEKIYKQISSINLSYMSPYEKYGVNMINLQDRLLELGYDLGNFGPKNNGVDGDFGTNTFLAIINLQKSLGQNPTGIADLSLLKLLFPKVFITINKNEGRSPEGVEEYLSNIISKYKNLLDEKNEIINNSKSQLKEEDDNIDENDLEYEEYIKPKKVDKTIEKNLEIKDYESFMNLSIEKRFNMLTKSSKDGYFIVDFYENFDQKLGKVLERKVSLDDIIPSNFLLCEVFRDSEYRVLVKGRKKIAHKNYFDIVSRDKNNNFDSMFSGGKYRKTIIKDGYIIKPFNKNNVDKINIISSGKGRNNELVIKKIYGEKINNYIKKYFQKNNSIIDEDLFYSLLKQESNFDPNAISHTGTRGLAMVTLSTSLGIIKRNEIFIKDKDFEKLEPSIKDLFITNINGFKEGNKFYKYIYKNSNGDKKIGFKGVETQFYNPLNSIKLSLSYLRIIEQEFSHIQDKDFKKDLILARYNAGTVINKITSKNKNIDSWEKLKIELKKELDINKYKEVVGYVEKINKYNV